MDRIKETPLKGLAICLIVLIGLICAVDIFKKIKLRENGRILSCDDIYFMNNSGGL